MKEDLVRNYRRCFMFAVESSSLISLREVKVVAERISVEQCWMARLNLRM